ncbi:hypothetical protein Pint_06793 [Pistacia integerrima]|uniref:Uncharacterized protein n=1 Tax=Pistacia integerrima TaxID=434235 RepID=A0ACC0XV88_9ROSI|nr:hypothetical protein Pint_06793 [Pistacia integerrima]
MAALSSSSSLPLNTMVHMLTIKLTSTNYLLWQNQFLPLLTSQGLFGYLDGSVQAPSPKITGSDRTTQENPAYTSWLNTDQTLLSLLYSSLTEESMGEVLGLSHAHEAWTTLEASFSHRSKTRELQLKEELQLMQRGSKSVAEFSHLFKGICDQLAAIGRPIDNLDKNSSSRPRHTQKGKPKPPSTSASKSFTSSSPPITTRDKEGHLAKRCWTFLNLKKKQSTNLVKAFAACSIPDSNDSAWYPDSVVSSNKPRASVHLWHARLGHPSFRTVDSLSSDGLGESFSCTSPEVSPVPSPSAYYLCFHTDDLYQHSLNGY